MAKVGGVNITVEIRPNKDAGCGYRVSAYTDQSRADYCVQWIDVPNLRDVPQASAETVNRLIAAMVEQAWMRNPKVRAA